MSYDGFQANDSHILNYYDNRIKYYLLDQGEAPPVNERADVVSSVCPCAGLSMMSHGYGDHNPNNQWMGKTAEHILGEYKPKVFWGENAPAFAGKIGTNVRAQLREIGKKNGYTMSVYRTRSLLHGAPQVRERSFYFFWKDIHGGRTQKEHSELVESKFTKSGLCVFTYIERNGYNFKQVSEWMTKHGYDNEAEKSMRKYEKLKSGGNIMKRGVTIPKDYIGAFVGHYPKMLTHPDEDRFITYREAMTIMGLPQDFELLNPKQSSNHICQNVPVQTAADMAGEVKKYIEGNAKMVDTDYIMQYNHSQKADYITNADTLEAFI